MQSPFAKLLELLIRFQMLIIIWPLSLTYYVKMLFGTKEESIAMILKFHHGRHNHIITSYDLKHKSGKRCLE
jgi:hypothetical protein